MADGAEDGVFFFGEAFAEDVAAERIRLAQPQEDEVVIGEGGQREACAYPRAAISDE